MDYQDEKFLGHEISNEKRQEILWKYSKNNSNIKTDGLHFNKAKANRYISEMTNEQKNTFLEHFGHYLKAMSYDIE